MTDWTNRVALDGVHAKLRGLEERLVTTGDDVAALDAAQSRADSVANLFGERASGPVPGERPADYRRRLLDALKAHAPKFKDKSLASISEGMLGWAEEQVYADAAAWANNPASVPPGQLRAIRERDESGRLITRWVGNDYMGAAWDVFASPGARGTVNRKTAGLE